MPNTKWKVNPLVMYELYTDLADDYVPKFFNKMM